MIAMKKTVMFLLLFLSGLAVPVCAQGQLRYGYVSYDSLLRAMPEYGEAKARLAQLRAQYEAEARYNETAFKRMFAEFLQGQKEFPQNILLKRQRDLQEAMEKGLAFRRSADSLLRRAEAELYAPLRAAVDSAVKAVGLERGYGYVVNTDERAYVFLHPEVAEDATPFVLEKLQAIKPY